MKLLQMVPYNRYPSHSGQYRLLPVVMILHDHKAITYGSPYLYSLYLQFSPKTQSDKQLLISVLFKHPTCCTQ